MINDQRALRNVKKTDLFNDTAVTEIVANVKS